MSRTLGLYWKVAMVLVLAAASPATAQLPSLASSDATTLPLSSPEWNRVGGTLSEDTRWTAEGGPYLLERQIVVPYGVTLSMGPGTHVVVDSPRENAAFRVDGRLAAEGIASNRVHIRSGQNPRLFDSNHSDSPNIELAYTALSGRNRSSSIGTVSGFTMKNSTASGFLSESVPGQGTVIESSFLYGSGGFTITNLGDVVVSNSRIGSPELDETSDYFRLVTPNPSDSGSFTLRGNSFGDPESHVIWLAGEFDSDPAFDASGNYWETTSGSTAEDRVVDERHDPYVVGRIAVAPVLSDDPLPARPTTRIDSAATGITAPGDVTFEFKSDGPNIIGHECFAVDTTVFSIDLAPLWEPCSSPARVTQMDAVASFEFQVRAVTATGDTSAPQRYRWPSDATPPQVEFTRTPASPTTATSAVFEFVASRSNMTFECQHGSRVWTCSSPQSLTDLANGTQEFRVTGVDARGARSAPIGHRWLVDRPSPPPSSPPQPPTAPAPSSPRFDDVRPGATHAEAIGKVAAAGIASGYGDGSFGPSHAVTRGQMASFLDRALDFPESPSSQRFPDVSGTHGRAIDRVAAAGVTTGFVDGTFRPGDPVTREQMASFLDRALGLPRAPAGQFSDVSGTHAGAVDRVAYAGITTGFRDGTFGPHHTVTRGQMASFLARALEL